MIFLLPIQWMLLGLPSFAEPGEESLPPISHPIEAQPSIDTMVHWREAKLRIESGDYTGGRLQASLAIEALVSRAALQPHPSAEEILQGGLAKAGPLDPDVQDEIISHLFLIAVSYDESGDFSTSITKYLALIEGQPTHARTLDATFRLARVYSKSGQHKLAQTTLDSIDLPPGAPELDAEKIRLFQAAFNYRAHGKQKHFKRLEKHLLRIPESQITEDRARLRYEIVSTLIAGMDDHPFTGGSAAVKRAHRKRMRLHMQTVYQMNHMIKLRRPLWISRALLIMSTQLMNTAFELQETTPPSHLSSGQRVHYEQQMALYIQATWVKALRYAQEGSNLASRLGLDPNLVSEFRALGVRLERAIEGQETEKDANLGPAESPDAAPSSKEKPLPSRRAEKK
jgi:hypothetical protein